MASASPLIWAWRAVLPSRRLSPQYGKKKRRYLPYNHQHLYFFLSEYLLALLGMGMWRGAPTLCSGCPHSFSSSPESLCPRVRVVWSLRVFCNCLCKQGQGRLKGRDVEGWLLTYARDKGGGRQGQEPAAKRLSTIWALGEREGHLSGWGPHLYLLCPLHPGTPPLLLHAPMLLSCSWPTAAHLGEL